MRKLRIGSRGSKLALAQLKEVIDRFVETKYEIKTFASRGDVDKITPIDLVEGTDFFTGTIEKALKCGAIDLAVHSAKDLPVTLPAGLEIAVKTRAIDPTDVLVSRTDEQLLALPRGARIGTSSSRRKQALRKVRKDLDIRDLRGNVEERLAQLDRGDFDAIVLAAAGLVRLGLAGRITERLPFKTAKGQGSLALEIRKNDEELKVWLKEKFI